MNDFKKALKILLSNGCEEVRHRATSHKIMKNKQGKRFVLPTHKSIDKGTRKAIEKQSGVKLW